MTPRFTRRAALSLGVFTLASPFILRRLPAAAAPGPALPIPALVEPDSSGAVALRLMTGRHSFAPGHSVASAGINGAHLGPVVRLRTGAEVTLAVTNALPFSSSLHWHGLFVPSDADGGPHNPIAAGASWHPRVTIAQPPALTWFHPHPHGDTARQAHLGLAGALIVADGRDRERGLPDRYGVDDLVLVLQDRRVIDGDAPYAPDAMDLIHGFRGTIIAVNGAVAPVATVPAAIVRLRLLNGANARNFILRFADDRPMRVVASDGGFLAQPVDVDRLVVAPGERYEVLADFSDGRATTLLTGPDDNGRFGSGMMDRMKAMVAAATGEDQIVMTFSPDPGLGGGVTSQPTSFDDPGAVDPSVAVGRRSFLFDERLADNMAAAMGQSAMPGPGAGHAAGHGAGHGGMAMDGMTENGMTGNGMTGDGMDHSAHAGRTADETGPSGTVASFGIAMALAGQPFAMDRIDVRAKLGSHEIWTLTTQEMAHPFHIHGASFRILSRNGAAPAAHETGWKDVALIDGTADLLIRFDRPTAADKPFMFHCHMLEHEDAGMMGQFVAA